ncbi:TonB-dependent receptor [Salibacter halophilus]|uniref:TonB-dependent receptor plug domain-containing protein n=1 Tax=Salibacter halophilus TaxID=1803916 RepID=A0A6N6M7M1_9FLAO|nr:TonB-dependent receptor [Salibacter halophilus]KAB1063933.1 TonB-dependent receptor plug domain-containing protein [Salibacter halophilus]
MGKLSSYQLRPILALIFWALAGFAFGQNVIEGQIIDKTTGETLIGATVVIKGTSTGSTTDFDGNFSVKTDKEPPLTLVISFMGYKKQEIEVTDFSDKIKVKLESDNVLLDAVEIVDTRITDRQKQAPLTVETMDVIAIKEAPSGNFYESLGTLKGVDMTSASLGFKVINTRGFNSTSPVRSLQLIDGVDNQSPGLNFSLGNFLGASDLDVKSVDIVAGASSAYYGPGAFNGVINMTTKDPFVFQGLSGSVKVGERNMLEGAIRWAQAIKNKDGEEKFAYKINAFYLQANDWEAENYSPVYDSESARSNPGGYDAVNIYGDERVESNADESSAFGAIDYPGLNTFHRTGYKEVNLADYNTQNAKLGVAFHYKFREDLRAIVASNYSTGTTVYQGDNRYSLKDIQFFQNRFEIRQDDKWFFRAYATHENSGNSYDIVTTAIRLQEASMGDVEWNEAYKQTWGSVLGPQVTTLPGYPNRFNYDNAQQWQEIGLNPFLSQYRDSIVRFHQLNRQYIDSQLVSKDQARYYPGTARFDSAFNNITSKKFTDGGSLFYDRSALYHVQGEYKFEPSWATIRVGGSARLYTPDTRGTIFNDTLEYTRQQTDTGTIITDSAYKEITNFQYGVYAGLERYFFKEQLKASATLRMDKNENFDYIYSPALTMVYTPNEKHTFRTTFSSAVRNPTMADQFLYYDVGRAILLGGLNGYDSLVTTESFESTLSSLNQDSLDYFNVDPIKPEQVRTVELGYRGIFNKKVFVDASYYHSWYTNFIGYQIGIDAEFNNLNFLSGFQPYRISSNAQSTVTTQGFSIGANYYFAKKLTLNGNYSWNKLVSGDDDPIIPAFNTPEHKYNLGISGRELSWGFLPVPGFFGFSANYKWVEGFIFEGSPQFTGPIDSYGLVDAQINYNWPRINTTFKLGASNLLNNEVYQVYGGPRVGRLAYFSILYEWKRKR